MGKIKLLLTGGHAATTAYSVIEEIKKQDLPWELHFIGRKWATEDRKALTLEYKLLPALGVKFHALESGKIQTKFTRYTIPALLTIPFGFFQSLFLLLKVRPKVTLSFGGASGALVSFWSFLAGIPVIIHEQTATLGRANKFASRLAKKVAISRPGSAKYLPESKIVLTGNPVSREVLDLAGQKSKGTIETIFVTGGSRGSERINKAVFGILPELLKKYKVIHQVGEANIGKYSYKSDKYKIYGQIEAAEMPGILSNADLVIGRAGANTVSELIALKKPSILIPIPWSYEDEQTKNAEYAYDLGIARILPQDRLSPENLLKEIETIASEYSDIIKKADKLPTPDLHASENLVALLTKYIA